MTTTTFDTLGYAKRLEAAGFTRQQAEQEKNVAATQKKVDELNAQQAEAQNAALQKILESRDRELATRGDLRETELRLQKEIEGVRAEIKDAELRLLKWQIGIMLTGFGALAVIMAKGFGWLGF